MKLVSFILLLVILPVSVLTMYGTGYGIVLYSMDEKTRSGILSSDHRCSNFPKQFKAAYVKNTGGSHCALWTNTNCQGTLYVVPAHYKIRLPREKFESVIC
ncbi:MAG: hypothetical protein EXX96DRAFT_590780 [Benjaminiella poitrasii]|nr:MAG: hypothetical protein EXX96DRAFT_590780 [Benjaminiella poitrasii]